MLETLRKLNPDLPIGLVTSPEFGRFGRVVQMPEMDGFIRYLDRETDIPETGNRYVASDGGAEKPELMQRIQKLIYGGMPIEMGWCSGHNTKLNALEYHKGSEVDVAASASVLLLASLFDVREGKLDSKLVEGFYLQKGQAVELYATTLHYSPCAVTGKGFKMGVILPKGTNEPIDRSEYATTMLWARNKWLLVHPDAENLIGKGACACISGKNLEVRYQ